MDQNLYRKCLIILSMMAMIGTSTAAYAGTPWRTASATFYGDETASATMGKFHILLHYNVCKTQTMVIYRNIKMKTQRNNHGLYIYTLHESFKAH